MGPKQKHSKKDPEQVYEVLEKVGKGAFGEVYRGLKREDGQVVAIKIIDLEAAQDEIEDIQAEIHIMSQLDSIHVTKYYGSYIKGTKLWIIMEFCGGGSCLDLLKSGVLQEMHICVIITEVLKGLEHLHGQGKLHRDIKAANILVCHDGRVKLADFGVSGQLSATFSKKNTFAGTPLWMAPEVIEQAGYDEKADIWSVGITAMELAVGKPPYHNLKLMQILNKIPNSQPPVLEGDFSNHLKDFVSLALTKDPEKRPSAKDLLKHKFSKGEKDVAILKEVLARHEVWLTKQGPSSTNIGLEYQIAYLREDEDSVDAGIESWNFGTIRSALAPVANTTVSKPIPNTTAPKVPPSVPIRKANSIAPPPPPKRTISVDDADATVRK